MERVFKIKTRSMPDLSNQYPSERRYSASIVLGLSCILFQLGLCAILMGSLIIHKMYVLRPLMEEDSMRSLSDKLQRDLEFSDQNYVHYYVNVPVLISTGCFIMAFGDVAAFITGLLAWKRWYIDHNITLFFLSCSVTTLVSFVSLLISLLTISNMKFDRFEDYDTRGLSPLSLPLAINIIVLSVMNGIWAFLSVKIAYKGMKNSYPDDMVKAGRVEVSTIKKGSQNNISNIPIEVINTFAVGKMAKYLPKIERNNENNDLAKQESKAEYQQRVDRFLNAQPNGPEAHPEAMGDIKEV